jgi:hypothetical protein
VAAARLWGAAERARDARGLAGDPAPLPAALMPGPGRGLGEEAFAAAVAAGSQLTLETAVAEALRRTPADRSFGQAGLDLRSA